MRSPGSAPLPDVVVLNIAMPAIDGLSVTRRLRNRGLAVPVLLLTARDAVPQRVEGLEAGADDYLVKPFDPDELIARIRALLRRNRPPTELLAFGDTQLDPPSGEAWRTTGTQADAPEALLLALLSRHGRGIVERETALEQIRRGVAEVTANTGRSLCPLLRRELGTPHHRDGPRHRISPARTVRHSLRARTVAAAGVAIALAVVLLGGLVLARVERQLEDALDEQLRARSAEVARLHATTRRSSRRPARLKGGSAAPPFTSRSSTGPAGSSPLGRARRSRPPPARPSAVPCATVAAASPTTSSETPRSASSPARSDHSAAALRPAARSSSPERRAGSKRRSPRRAMLFSSPAAPRRCWP